MNKFAILGPRRRCLAWPSFRHHKKSSEKRLQEKSRRVLNPIEAAPKAMNTGPTKSNSVAKIGGEKATSVLVATAPKSPFKRHHCEWEYHDSGGRQDYEKHWKVVDIEGKLTQRCFLRKCDGTLITTLRGQRSSQPHLPNFKQNLLNKTTPL